MALWLPFGYGVVVTTVTPLMITNLRYKMFIIFGTAMPTRHFRSLSHTPKGKSMEETDILFGAVSREAGIHRSETEVYVRTWPTCYHQPNRRGYSAS